MEYITSRPSLPTSREKMEATPRFNMWQRRLWPYREIGPGDTLYWYDASRKAIVWRSRVSDVTRFEYEEKGKAAEELREFYGEPVTEDPYFENKDEGPGYCIGLTVSGLESVKWPKPDGLEFPQLGWLDVADNPRAQEWVSSGEEDQGTLDDIQAGFQGVEDPLEPITDPETATIAADQFIKTFSQGADRLEKELGWQGGNDICEVLHHPNLGIWGVFEPDRHANRYWFCFGTEDPTEESMLSITCEANPPKEGINRRMAGVFLEDAEGNIWLGHSGKIGGGRAGIGKEAFREMSRLAKEQVAWPDGKTTQHFVVCRIDSPKAPAQVKQFVSEVDRFKAQVAGGTSQGASQGIDEKPTFTPEFEGERDSYEHSSPIEAHVDHGTVVGALADVLEQQGYQVANDERDLYIVSDDGSTTHVFEVKTSLGSYDLYTAVGQLFLYTALDSADPERILVLPTKPKGETRSAVETLDLTVLQYEWNNGSPVFPNLRHLPGLQSGP